MIDRVSCSAGSVLAGEQLAGTAPEAVAWVTLEQSGPWGPKAFTDSHLDADLGRAVESAAAAHAIRPSLVRRPGRHADRHPHGEDDPRRLMVAHTRPGHSWLLEAVVDTPKRVLDLDWAAVARGDVAAVRRSLPALARTDRPHLLVCTNGRRDVCCAVEGRPVAVATAERHPGQVWEVTHTSGHRFAPTAVLLPAGTLHGRLDVGSAAELLGAAARGETVLSGSRGRSTWPSAAQVAELAVREHTGELHLDALTVTDHEVTGDQSWSTTVTHRDGSSWQVRTQARPSDELRAESCGKPLKPMTYLTTHLARSR